VPDLYAALKKYWGYDTFRPMQERIVESLLAGSDVAVIMPTGGGKSLCYQLPALALGQTVVVVSPLIALMQDQVAQLGDMGIPAAVLNSTQPAEEQRAVMRAARRAPSGCCTYRRNGWRGRTPSTGCAGCRWRFSPSTRRTASPNGATSSAPNTASSARCARTSR